MAWLQLNRELLGILGEARFAQAIERSAYNDLLGAATNGEDWCYYSFPNGRRVHTTYWRCCKSSGAIALEELPALAYGTTADGTVAVNLLGPSEAMLDVPGVGAVRVTQATGYPFDGAIEVSTEPPVPLLIRIPDWAEGARLNGEPVEADRFARVASGCARLDLLLPPRLVRAAAQNVQESLAPDGSPVAQQVLRHEYVALVRGPLVYATGLIDGFKPEETVRLSDGAVAVAGDRLVLSPRDRPPIAFEPYYRVGDRADGAWRISWLRLAPGATA